MGKKTIFKTIAFVLATAFIFLSVSSVSLAKKGERDNRPTVKVGFFESEMYGYIDANGCYRGYDIELLKMLGIYGGFYVDTVPYTAVEDMIDALDDGEVDCLIDFLKTSERERKYIFSDHSIMNESVNIYVMSDNKKFKQDDVSELSDMTVGYIEGSGFYDYFIDYCHKVNATPVMRELSDENAVRIALENGRIDAALTGSTVPPGYKRLMTFDQETSYMMFRKADTELKGKFDRALDTLLLDDPAFLGNLYKKYIMNVSDEISPLTEEERDFLDSHNGFKVSLVKDAEPFVMEGQDGDAKGIIPEYYKVLGEKLGTEFEIVLYDTTEEAVASVARGETDIFGHYYGDVITADGSGFLVTEHYDIMDCAAVTRKDFKGELKTAAVTFRTAESINEQFDGKIGLKKFDSIEKCYDAVMRGDADAFIGTITAATWLINQHTLRGIRMAVVPQVQLSFAGIVTGDSYELLRILDKAIRASHTDIRRICTEHSVMNTENFGTIIENIPSVYIIIFMLALIALIITLIVLLLLLVRRQKEHIAVEADKKANEKRDAFFSNVSHDMRTPLNAIIGFTDLASAEKDSSEVVKEYLQKISVSGRVLQNLINDTLMISSISNGKMVLSEVSFYLSEMYDECFVPAEAAAEEAGVTFEKVLPQKDYILSADRMALQKIIMNITANAIMYTKNGGHVRDEIRVKPEGQVLHITIIVSDDGIGMSDAFVEHIFEPFAQEHRSEDSPGTGLGLTIAKQLVDLMDGTIEIDSMIDRGSTFTVSLTLPGFEAAEGLSDKIKKRPIFENPFKEKNTAELPIQRLFSDTANEKLSAMTILVCEDNDLNREIAMKILERKGVTVKLARDGKEGLQVFSDSKDGSIDCILMDIRMPVMDGNEATAAIRALDRKDAKKVPIIALSADVFKSDLEKSKKAGVDAHLSKPIDAAQLISKILEITGR